MARGHHHVYVVELDPKVAAIGRFREANPAYRDGRMCFYVGMTGLSPEEHGVAALRGSASRDTTVQTRALCA